MQIIWLGHGSFCIEIAGLILLIGPWLGRNPMLPQALHQRAVTGASHILITHGHADHSADALTLASALNVPILGQYDLMAYWSDTEKVQTTGFNKGGTVDLDGVAVTMVHAVHSSSMSAPDGPRFVGTECGFMISGDGQTIYVSGDTDVMADMKVFIDALPVGSELTAHYGANSNHHSIGTGVSVTTSDWASGIQRRASSIHNKK